MQGTINVYEVMRGLESRKEWRERMDRLVEREAQKWLQRAESDAERDKTLELYGDVLRRVWERKGYSPKWIAKQLGC